MRVPVEVELRRRVFYVDDDDNLLDARKARSVSDGEYRSQKQSKQLKDEQEVTTPLKVKGVDFVALWRVFNSESGESVAVRSLLGRQASLPSIETQLPSLVSLPEPRLGVTEG
jgi:hypothetical protein